MASSQRNKVCGKREREEEQYFLKDLFVFVKTEPCFMCAMALVHSRVARLYFENVNRFDGAIEGVEGGIQLNYLKNTNHNFPTFKIIK